MSIDFATSALVVGLASLGHFPIGNELGQTLTSGHIETYRITQGAVGELPDERTAYDFCRVALLQFRLGRLKKNFTDISECRSGEFNNVGDLNFFESKLALPSSVFRQEGVRFILADTCWFVRATFAAGGYDQLRAVGWLLNDANSGFNVARQFGLHQFAGGFFDEVMRVPLECSSQQDDAGVHKIRIRVPYSMGDYSRLGVQRFLRRDGGLR